MKHFICLFGFALLLPAAEPMRIDTLDGPWKAHSGDDLRWAAPDFDDSAWPEIVPPLPEPGFAWYRRTVQIPAELKAPVALWFPALTRQAEVYVNGRLALQRGIPGQWFTQRYGPSPVIDLPDNAPGTTVVIAWRVNDAKFALLDLWGPVLLGSRAALTDGYERQRFRLFRMNFSWLLLGLLNLLFAAAVLALWRMQPDQPVYFWFALAITLESVWSIPFFAVNCFDLPAVWALPGDFGFGVELAAWVFLFHSTPVWPGWKNVRIALPPILLIAAIGGAAHSSVLPWSSYFSINLIGIAGAIFLAVRGVWNGEAGQRRALMILLVPWLVYELGLLVFFFGSVQGAMGNALTENSGLRGLLVLLEPIEVDLTQAGAILSILAMAGVLLARFSRVSREQQALSTELEAARRVQEFLVPAAEVRVPGYELESAYLPAQRVGGDFFQFAPIDGGGLLVLVGDVSGKGLRAAMLVSLIVGAFRNRHSDQPGEILGELNAVLAGQMDGGFVTACCARFELSSGLAIANAGHPAPYCDAREAEVEAGLPLGLVRDASYQESVAPGNRFTFVSDGVVEAENAQRQIFGFDRTREISTRPAAEVAEAARAWGQNDDITVVTVRRVR